MTGRERERECNRDKKEIHKELERERKCDVQRKKGRERDRDID